MEENKPFNPDKYLAEKQKMMGVEPEPQESKPEVSTGEAFLRGGAQGLSLGTADEITGAIEAAQEQGIHPIDLYNDPKKLEDLIQSYRKHRGESRAAYKEAEEAHPLAYMGGTMAGGIAPVALTGGGGALATIGKAAALGAVTGAGTSSADLTTPNEEQLGQLAKDVGIGGAVGGVTAGLGEGIKLAGKFGPGKTISQAYEQGKQGNMLVGEEARKGIQKEIVDYASEAEKQIQDKIKENALKQGQLLEQATAEGQRIPVGPLQEMTEAEIAKMPKAFGEAKRGRQELRNLFTEAADSDKLGEDYVKQASDLIAKGAKITDVLREGGELSPKDFIGFKRALSRLGYEKDLKDDQVVALAKRLAGKASDMAEEKIPGLGEVNKNISKLKGAQETFNVSGQATDEIGNMKKVATLIDQLEKENLSSEVGRQKFAKAIEDIREVYPEMADQMEKKFYDLSEKANVAKKISGNESFYTRHLIKGAASAGSNLLGVGVNKMKAQPIIDSVKKSLKTIPQSGQLQLAPDIQQEEEKPKQTPSKDHSRNLYNMDNNDLVAHLERSIGEHPQFQERVGKLREAIANNDNERKNKILFSLVQNPLFREATDMGVEDGRT